jgi:hypothetical protein
MTRQEIEHQLLTLSLAYPEKIAEAIQANNKII